MHSRIAHVGTQALRATAGTLWTLAADSHRIWRRRRKPSIPPPVLVVGSRRAGGTGKTDLVEWIAARYPHLAVLVHPTGDEEHWLRERLGERVFAADDLLQAWETAHGAGFEAAVSDGGLQDPAFEDCAALDLELDDSPIGWADLHPCGPFRERLPRPRAALLTLDHGRDLKWTSDPASLPTRGTEIVAACAIARPGAFIADLERHGLVAVEHIAFPDHRVLPAAVVEAVRARHPGATWVVTEKDLARAGQRLPEGARAMRRILSIGPEAARQIGALVPGAPGSRMAVTPRG